MSFNLSEQEIKQRLVRLTNLEKLHTADRKKIKKQSDEIKILKQRIETVEEQNKELIEINKKFSLQLEELRTKVFGKKKGKDKDKKPKGGKKADRLSSSYQREIPKDITKEENHSIDTCNLCNSILKKKRIRVFYVEDIPFTAPQREAVKHTVEQGYCVSCRKWASPIPLPPAKVTLDLGVQKMVSYLSINQRLSNQQIEDQIREVHQIKLSQGEIQKMIYREAIRLTPEREKLVVRIRNQIAQQYDETVWKVLFGKYGNYGWGMFGTETPEMVFLLGKSRGGGNLDDLNPNRNIGITDDYGVYKNAFKHHQLCWAHPHRKFRDLAESNELSGVQKENCIFDFRAFAKIYKRLKQTVVTEFEYEKTRKYFIKKISEFAKPNLNDIQKTRTLKATLLKNREKYLTVLKFPKLIPLDNNRAERGIRHLVIKRKISYGSKTDRGAEATSILASVLLSLKWMNPDTFFQKYFLEGC